MIEARAESVKPIYIGWEPRPLVNCGIQVMYAFVPPNSGNDTPILFVAVGAAWNDV